MNIQTECLKMLDYVVNVRNHSTLEAPVGILDEDEHYRWFQTAQAVSRENHLLDRVKQTINLIQGMNQEFIRAVDADHRDLQGWGNQPPWDSNWLGMGLTYATGDVPPPHSPTLATDGGNEEVDVEEYYNTDN